MWKRYCKCTIKLAKNLRSLSNTNIDTNCKQLKINNWKKWEEDINRQNCQRKSTVKSRKSFKKSKMAIKFLHQLS